MVEQTTFVDTNPNRDGGGSKKQRRRKSEENNSQHKGCEQAPSDGLEAAGATQNTSSKEKVERSLGDLEELCEGPNESNVVKSDGEMGDLAPEIQMASDHAHRGAEGNFLEDSRRLQAGEGEMRAQRLAAQEASASDAPLESSARDEHPLRPEKTTTIIAKIKTTTTTILRPAQEARDPLESCDQMQCAAADYRDSAIIAASSSNSSLETRESRVGDNPDPDFGTCLPELALGGELDCAVAADSICGPDSLSSGDFSSLTTEEEAEEADRTVIAAAEFEAIGSRVPQSCVGSAGFADRKGETTAQKQAARASSLDPDSSQTGAEFKVSGSDEGFAARLSGGEGAKLAPADPNWGCQKEGSGCAKGDGATSCATEFKDTQPQAAQCECQLLLGGGAKATAAFSTGEEPNSEACAKLAEANGMGHSQAGAPLFEATERNGPFGIGATTKRPLVGTALASSDARGTQTEFRRTEGEGANDLERPTAAAAQTLDIECSSAEAKRQLDSAISSFSLVGGQNLKDRHSGTKQTTISSEEAPCVAQPEAANYISSRAQEEEEVVTAANSSSERIIADSSTSAQNNNNDSLDSSISGKCRPSNLLPPEASDERGPHSERAHCESSSHLDEANYLSRDKSHNSTSDHHHNNYSNNHKNKEEVNYNGQSETSKEIVIPTKTTTTRERPKSEIIIVAGGSRRKSSSASTTTTNDSPSTSSSLSTISSTRQQAGCQSDYYPGEATDSEANWREGVQLPHQSSISQIGCNNNNNNIITNYSNQQNQQQRKPQQEAGGSSNSGSQAGDLQSSSTTYTTAPLATHLINSSSSNADFTTVSTSLYETARSSLTAGSLRNEADHQLTRSTSSSNSLHENNTTSEMVSFSLDERLGPSSQPNSSDAADSQTMTPNTEELEDLELIGDGIHAPVVYSSTGSKPTAMALDQELTSGMMKPPLSSSPVAGSSSQDQQPAPMDSSSSLAKQASDFGTNEISLDDCIDEEQLKRILACKRLSEGCNRFTSSFVTRKNSLHMIEELPPLTEGETMKHMPYHLSQTIDQSTASSSSSAGSSRLNSRPLALMRDFSLKRGSQDENTSCSSSTSLERSPSRRRSSTVSQCSSVLSESARNQLNFDLSPDLPPDSSLLEANALSPTEFNDEDQRPASPEPSSLSNEPEFEFRPVSRLTPDELMLPSPDSTLGDSNDNEIMEEQLARLTRSCCQPPEEMDAGSGDQQADNSSEIGDRQQVRSTPEQLERLISDVSCVAVSCELSGQRAAAKRPASECAADETGSRQSKPGQRSNRSMLPRLTSDASRGGGGQNSTQAAGSNDGQMDGAIARPSSAAMSALGRSRILISPSPSANSSSCSSSSRSSNSSKISSGNNSTNNNKGKPNPIEQSRSIS